MEHFGGSLRASRGEALEIEEPVVCRDTFDIEEIDVAFFSEQAPGGLLFLPWLILVKCKNWLKPVGSEHVS
jgi:hypothetical protein